MNRLLPTLAGVGLALGCATGAGADERIDANLSFTSDYTFRGISQRGESFAVQGGFDYAFENGLRVGTWASTIDDQGFNGASAEIDLYAGVSGTFADSPFGWSVDAVYYHYPDQADTSVNVDYIELSPSLTYAVANGVSAALGISVSHDYFFESGDSQYYSLNLRIPVLDRVSVAAHVGHQRIEENAVFGVPDYSDWSLGVSATVAGLAWSLAYVDTDVDEGRCFGGSQLCTARAVVSVSKNF